MSRQKKIKKKLQYKFLNFLISWESARRRRGGEAVGNCGTVLRGVRTAAHRGIGPGYWPTEVGAARAGCHCVAGACLADRADTYPYRVMQVR